MREEIDLFGYPRVLIVGASHATHWATYAKKINCLNDDSTKLENFRFVGVGGARLDNICDWVQGRKLPRKKKHLGDQLGDISNSGFSPDFIVITVGSNTVDRIDRKAKAILRKNNRQYSRTKAAIQKMMVREFYRQRKYQWKIVEMLRKYFNMAKICYIYIFPRRCWTHYAREFASLLDFNFTRKVVPGMKCFKVPELYEEKRKLMSRKHGFMDNIMRGFLDTDRLHLSKMGYHVLTKKVLVPLSESLYNN